MRSMSAIIGALTTLHGVLFPGAALFDVWFWIAQMVTEQEGSS
jgi:hypothetical protein